MQDKDKGDCGRDASACSDLHPVLSGRQGASLNPTLNPKPYLDTWLEEVRADERVLPCQFQASRVGVGATARIVQYLQLKAPDA